MNCDGAKQINRHGKRIKNSIINLAYNVNISHLDKFSATNLAINPAVSKILVARSNECKANSLIEGPREGPMCESVVSKFTTGSHRSQCEESNHCYYYGKCKRCVSYKRSPAIL